ncbi:hypothetical protein WJX73_003712 [Symbiochloris irregularis]|uniref:Uncharacterized protein n=1 Tax=Symbiochloris irregularis TaxID=706552 RepID=A0AAW1PVQ5_9CHLO
MKLGRERQLGGARQAQQQLSRQQAARHLLKTMRAAERMAGKLGGMRTSHDDMRLALCRLWAQQEAFDIVPLERALLQLTRLMWSWGVIGAAGTLGECVSAERSAEMHARGVPQTPTLYDAGKAAFRSQVVLGYGLCSPLQQALVDGARARSRDAAPAWLLGASRLLHILDVMDDATAQPASHTQAKLRRVFGMDMDDMRHAYSYSSIHMRKR